MPREDGPGLVIEASRTGPTVLALTVGLGLVFAVLDDLLGIAMRAGDPVRPTEVSNGLEALGVVDEIGEIDHGGTPCAATAGVGTLTEAAEHEDRIGGSGAVCRPPPGFQLERSF